MKGTLYLSNFANIKKGKGIKISIARYSPKWLKSGIDYDLHLVELAPEQGVLLAYREGTISWSLFSTIYKLRAKERAFKLGIREIKTLLNSGHDVTLYCYESKGDNCHRYLLGDMFKESGYNVEEI